MIPEVIDRGPIRWYTYWQGICGGCVRLLIWKNRLTFVKTFTFATDEDFDLACRILREKHMRILHMKHENHPQIYRMANYAVDASDVVEVTKEEFNYAFETLT